MAETGEITVHRGLFKNVDLYVEDTGGDGRPVVLIHGWPLSAASWAHQVPAFAAAGYRVVDYDRRGFGRSDKPASGYDYDTFAEDLGSILDALDLTDVTLIGFSMGGGEIARYIAEHGERRLRSVVFASAVPPFLAQSDDNPDGPLTKEAAAGMEAGLTKDRDGFFAQFVHDFYSADGELKVSQKEVDDAIALAQQSDQKAALGAMAAFGTTDFRDDLTKITVPTLVIHGDADGIVPFEGSGQRTAAAIPGSETVVIQGAPHGVNVSDAAEWNAAVLAFLAK
ncbi:alpha/beta fold hydrolase [uncultured Amnibacterium sp.]|uniref:alpha/beta fold hydrolase n=1 Tax=uncultured Amnibacterium sp. TaxID=1631851 RepID=UPI0035CAFA07